MDSHRKIPCKQPMRVLDTTGDVGGADQTDTVTDLFRFTSARASDREALQWLQSIDTTEKVGAKHHIVPMMILRRFSNPKGQLYVRDRASGAGNIRNANDLAVRDFNTVVTKDAKLDSSLESLLSVVEGAAAAVIRSHLDAEAFARPRPFSAEERFKIDTFVAMQSVRGMRQRRAYELIADYGIKLLNQENLTADDIENLSIVPHPNEYIQMSAKLSERAHETLAARPVTLVRIDRPLFIIGDEPVLLLRDDSSMPEASRRGYPELTGPGIEPENVIQLQSGGGLGMGNADAVIMPMSSRAALVYGPTGHSGSTAPRAFRGDEADEAAAEVNAAVLRRAVSWVAASPQHPTFHDMTFPPPVPLLQIADGGSAIAQRTNADTRRHPMRRLRPSDVHDVPEWDSVGTQEH